MIKTTGFKNVDFFSQPNGPRRRMLPADYGRNAGRRWFSRVGAYAGHVQSADGWFYRRVGSRDDWRITSGVNVPSNRRNHGDGYNVNPSKETFYLINRWVKR